MNSHWYIIASLVLAGGLGAEMLCQRRVQRHGSRMVRERLWGLLDREQEAESLSAAAAAGRRDGGFSMKQLRDRLGRAGFLTRGERSRAVFWGAVQLEFTIFRQNFCLFLSRNSY